MGKDLAVLLGVVIIAAVLSGLFVKGSFM